MLAIAVVGLAANGVSAWFLSRSAGDNLNVRAALLHVIGDALGSVAAIGAALAMLLFDLFVFDAIAGLVIAALLVVSAVRLVREAADILLEGTPKDLDLELVAGRVGELGGVRSIHDFHIWTVTSGFLAMSAHVDLEPGADPELVRQAVHRLLHQEYGIEHTTIQTEAHQEPRLLSIEAPASD
jgi:cobalt-zinc-cadmium efflux system protein